MGVKVREKIKGSGEWWVFIHHKGIRKSKKVGDEETAIEVAKMLEAKITLKDFKMNSDDDKPTPLFKTYSKLWLDDYIKS
jgi:integrase